MDTTGLMEASAGEEILIPVTKWGGVLSPNSQRFFHEGYETSEEAPETVGKYFLEVLRLSDTANLRAGLSTVVAVIRGYSKYFAALLDKEIIDTLMKMVTKSDTSLSDKAAYLISGVMARNAGLFSGDNLMTVVKYSGSELGKLDVVANLLKCDVFRADIFKLEGNRILSGLESSSVPVIYKALFCIWLVSFNKELLDTALPASIIKSINNIIQINRTEKVIRISLCSIENLLKNKKMCEEMAEAGTVDLVSALEYEKWRDPELTETIKSTVSSLYAEVKLLTNFERFEREVNSGSLKWGFIHTDKFWIENVLKCEQKNFSVIDKLMIILKTSYDPESLAVACHDIGEFARLHPVGKQIATSRGAKDKMLELMSSAQREVAREALLCVQKLMLQKATDLSAIVA